MTGPPPLPADGLVANGEDGQTQSGRSADARVPSVRAGAAEPFGAPAPAAWRPTATFAALRRRAELLATIRSFFATRGVLEVETPALAGATVTDLHLASFSTVYRGPGAPQGRRLYLQTSPEFAMKRLLAAGSGPIFQLAKSFRDEEVGERHNPEFTMLEWYRPGFDHHQLMDEMDALLAVILGSVPAERLTYVEAFARHVGVDPHRADAGELAAAAARHGLGEVVGLSTHDDDRDSWLQLLMALVVEPQLGGRVGRGEPVPERGEDARRAVERPDLERHDLETADIETPGDGKQSSRKQGDREGGGGGEACGEAVGGGERIAAWRPTFVHDFPASQAALARVRPAGPAGEPALAERFEVYVGGVELANGFHELADPAEQRRRFLADLERRRAAGLPQPPLDEHLLAALGSGSFPDCAGVALGVDRLVMIALGARFIAEVIAFPLDRA